MSRLVLSRLHPATFAWMLLISGALAHIWMLRMPVEDSYISFRFAENLAAGHGLIWNVGESPVEGYTCFLWVVLLAGMIQLGFSVEPAAQCLGTLVSLGTLYLVFRFSRDVLEQRGTRALVPSFMLALSGPFAAWAASGMETALFSAFVVWGVLGFSLWIKNRKAADARWSHVALLLAALTRPEGALVAAVLGGAGLAFGIERSRRKLVEFALESLIFWIPFLGYWIWRSWFFGELLPLTYYAKTGGTFLQYWRGVEYAGSFAALFLLPYLPALLLGVDLLPRAVRWRTHPTTRTPVFGLAVCALTATVYAVYIVYVGGDYMPMYRFFVPVLSCLYLVLAAAICKTFDAASSRTRRVALSASVALGLAGTMLHSTPLEAALVPRLETMEGTYRGVQLERWYVRRYRVIAEMLMQRAQSQSDSLGTFSIGVIPYLTKLRTYSPFGLTDPVIARQGKSLRPLGTGYPGHEKLDLERWIAHEPTYLLLGFGLSPEVPEKSPRVPRATLATVQRLYRPVSVWIEDRANQEAGYFTFFERRDVERVHGSEDEVGGLNTASGKP